MGFAVALLGASSGCSGKTLPVGEVMNEGGGGAGGSTSSAGGSTTTAGAGAGGSTSSAGGSTSSAGGSTSSAGGVINGAGGLFNGAGGGLLMGSGGGTNPGCFFSVQAPQDGSAGAPADEVCSCTRRPVRSGNSVQCPKGEGINATHVVGPEGGVISLSGSESTRGVSVELRIPPGALSEPVNIDIAELPIPPPDGISDWSPIYRFEPWDLEFAKPVQVRIPWASDQTEVDREKLKLYWSSDADGCTLAPLSDSYVNAGFNQGSTRRLGFAIVGMARSPNSTCP